mgnify:CR=1 FL=1
MTLVAILQFMNVLKRWPVTCENFLDPFETNKAMTCEKVVVISLDRLCWRAE